MTEEQEVRPRAWCLSDFILAGHATTVEDELREPVTVSGYYKGKHLDYWYYVAWVSGRITVGPIGYSAAYLNAEKDYERQRGGVMDEEGTEEGLRFIARALGL